MSEKKTSEDKVSSEKGSGEKTPEERPPSAEKKIVEERIYSVPLKATRYVPPNRRAAKAIRILRKFIGRHLKSENVIILPEVNEEIWKRGIENPPRKIRVKASKDEEGVVEVALAVEE
ncbi:MAG: 50S ribosomal protein L31e [Candidatus Jordarchaeaceae archaeon]